MHMGKGKKGKIKRENGAEGYTILQIHRQNAEVKNSDGKKR
jgi:hypothetical protein